MSISFDVIMIVLIIAAKLRDQQNVIMLLLSGRSQSTCTHVIVCPIQEYYLVYNMSYTYALLVSMSIFIKQRFTSQFILTMFASRVQNTNYLNPLYFVSNTMTNVSE